jgi:hypothetical protein
MPELAYDTCTRTLHAGSGYAVACDRVSVCRRHPTPTGASEIGRCAELSCTRVSTGESDYPSDFNFHNVKRNKYWLLRARVDNACRLTSGVYAGRIGQRRISRNLDVSERAVSTCKRGR